MNDRSTARVFSIARGAPFLPTLAQTLQSGALIPGFGAADDPLALSNATIYVPTRRAARALRGVFADSHRGTSAILPAIKALGEFDEDEAAFGEDSASFLDLAPPIAELDRLLLLAPVVREWKRRLPAHVAQLFDETVVVPVSTADSLWLARDLARLMDDVETEQSDWAKLASLLADDFAGWWQVTLKFLEIVTDFWPQQLAERHRSNPAAHRNALIGFEAERLKRNPPAGPVIAAGSTGSIPATADLLATIARLPTGAVVLPGLDRDMDDASWAELTAEKPEPPVLGHPQFGLARLLRKLAVARTDVAELGVVTRPLVRRGQLISSALRPTETTDDWPVARRRFDDAEITAALDGVSMIEAATERDEALTIAIALRQAISEPDSKAALVTGDRNLARRVCAELLRFGVQADDSGGRPLSATPPGALLRLVARAAFEPGDPLTLLALTKHPLLRLGQPRPVLRSAAELIELIALRGGTGRPDIATLATQFDLRLETLHRDARRASWFGRLTSADLAAARNAVTLFADAVQPLTTLRGERSVELAAIALATVRVLEALVRDENGSVSTVYALDAGEQLASFLRGLVAATAPLSFAPAEWPNVLEALMAPEMVKPRAGADRRIAIWGTLEARLQSVDTLVLGGLNEGSWPRKAETDRFMSRVMRTGIDLDPPERLIGLAAHDFEMALGTGKVVLSRASRAGDAPAVASRWWQRLTTFVGQEQTASMVSRGDQLLSFARQLDEQEKADFVKRPNPQPPLAIRPKHFSVTEIETLRRDPYAVYARRILGLMPVEPLVRDPNAAERGSLFHDILHRFSMSGTDPTDAGALQRLLEVGRAAFAGQNLPDDVAAVWWPRFEKLAGGIIAWEIGRPAVRRHAEARALKTPVDDTGVTLSGFADRLDVHPTGLADVLDYKTGSSPSKGQAHTLLAPQLALEGALLKRGAFQGVGALDPAELAFVRLKANGEVLEESILEFKQKRLSAEILSETAWRRLDELLGHYNNPTTGYLSRALPFREGDIDGDYDHLARVLEWSAGATDDSEAPE